jgi:accessory gene regulator B
VLNNFWIENLSNKIASKIKLANPDQTTDIEVMSFSLSFLINNILILVLLLLFGTVTDNIHHIIIAMVSFALLRIVTGGYHIKSSSLCVIVSTTILILISYATLNHPLLIGLNIISLILVAWFAPSKVENQTNIKKKYFPILKIIGTLIVLSNFYSLSGVMACAFFAQSLLLIYKREEKEVKIK